MKNKKYTAVLAIVSCLAFTACDKYLDVTPKGKTLLQTVSDYDQWLNDPILMFGVGQSYCNLNYLADNYDIPSVTIPPASPNLYAYIWSEQFSTDISVAPIIWGDHYANINKYNTVLAGIDEASGGTDNQRASLKAEALLGRAFEYFYLVNEYGKEYDSTTADTDLAVPFVTSNDVTQDVPGRSTIAEIYEHIISDINEAIPLLPTDNSSNRCRGSRAAGYSVLARVYFYARDYADAQKYATLALQNTKAVMIDLNATLPSTDPMLSIQPDVIYGRMVIGYDYPTLDFMNSFAYNDLRVNTLYYSLDNYTFTTRGYTYFLPAYRTNYFRYTNSGTSVQEMKLIVAECAARSNDLTTALQELDEVRQNRFDSDSYEPFESTEQEAVFDAVLEERSHELPFSGLRWFDMRRFDKENKMETVYRYDADGNVIATLPPHGDRYTLQIPLQVLRYNPDMIQNP